MSKLAEPNKGIARFLFVLSLLCLFGRLLGRGPQTVPGLDFKATVNLVIDDVNHWHVVFNHKRMWVRRGLSEGADAVVSAASRACFRLLSTDLSSTTAIAIGIIRVEGEAFAGLCTATLFEAFGQTARRPGFIGWFSRGVVLSVLELGAQPELAKQLREKSA